MVLSDTASANQTWTKRFEQTVLYSKDNRGFWVCGHRNNFFWVCQSVYCAPVCQKPLQIFNRQLWQESLDFVLLYKCQESIKIGKLESVVSGKQTDTKESEFWHAGKDRHQYILITFGYDIKENDRSISSKLFHQQGNLTNFPFIWVIASMICLVVKLSSRNAKSVWSFLESHRSQLVWSTWFSNIQLGKNLCNFYRWHFVISNHLIH